mgnify:CR=1 FL=1
MVKYVSLDKLSHFLLQLKGIIPTKTSELTNDSNYASDANYVHTDTNFTQAEKTKLSDIADGANKTTINDTLSGTSAEEALSAKQGTELKKQIDAINTNMGNLGAGDMMKATYDVDGDGVIDNSKKLNGKEASYYAAASAIPTKVSELENDSKYLTMHQDISGKADKATTLSGYGIANAYTKDETNSQIAAAVANADHLKREIVSALPATSAANANTIYMVLADETSADNKYIEWMFINGKFEKTGDTDTDLSGYWNENNLVECTNDEIDALFA